MNYVMCAHDVCSLEAPSTIAASWGAFTTVRLVGPLETVESLVGMGSRVVRQADGKLPCKWNGDDEKRALVAGTHSSRCTCKRTVVIEREKMT
jgi:hypothetical protein